METIYRGYTIVAIFNYSATGTMISDWQIYPPGGEFGYMLPTATYVEACEYVNDILNSQEYA